MGKHWVIIGTSCNRCTPSVIDVTNDIGKTNFIEQITINLNATPYTDSENDLYTPFHVDEDQEFFSYDIPKEQYHEYVKKINYSGCTQCHGIITIIEKKKYSIKELLERHDDF
jgi:hypothetical protein